MKSWKKNQPDQARPDFLIPGVPSGLGPLKDPFWAQNWKSMWKPFAVNILYFIGQFFLLIFGQFFDNF